MNRVSAIYKLSVLTVATSSAMSIWSPSTAVALSQADSGGAVNGASTGSGTSHIAVSTSKQSAARTVKKPFKMAYGNLLRNKPADPSNFGLLKSYCNHSRGKRWNAK
jgi:hypothetical protein